MGRARCGVRAPVLHLLRARPDVRGDAAAPYLPWAVVWVPLVSPPVRR